MDQERQSKLGGDTKMKQGATSSVRTPCSVFRPWQVIRLEAIATNGTGCCPTWPFSSPRLTSQQEPTRGTIRLVRSSDRGQKVPIRPVILNSLYRLSRLPCGGCSCYNWLQAGGPWARNWEANVLAKPCEHDIS